MSDWTRIVHRVVATASLVGIMTKTTVDALSIASINTTGVFVAFGMLFVGLLYLQFKALTAPPPEDA